MLTSIAENIAREVKMLFVGRFCQGMLLDLKDAAETKGKFSPTLNGAIFRSDWVHVHVSS